MKTTFSITKAFEFGWNEFKSKWKEFLPVSVVGFASMYALSFIAPLVLFGKLASSTSVNYILSIAYSLIVSLIFIVLYLCVFLNTAHIFIKICKNKEYKISDLFKIPTKNTWHLIMTASIVCLMFFIIFVVSVSWNLNMGDLFLFYLSLILVSISGVYLVTKYGLSLFFILNENMSTAKALKSSSTLVKNSKFKLFILNVSIGFIMILFVYLYYLSGFAGINYISILNSSLSILFFKPIVLIANIYAYEALLKQQQESLIESKA